MTITVRIRDLTSRAVRQTLTENSRLSGYREIVNSANSSGQASGGFFEIVKSFFGKGIRLTGWILGRVFGGIGFTFTALWGTVVQLTSFIYNFDWNISDQSIDQKFQSLKQIMAGYAGETLGNSIGYLACGVLPSAGILTFNQPLGLYLLKEVGEEALDEFCDNMANMLRFGFRMLVQSFAYAAFKNTRKAIKHATSDKNPQTRAMVQRIFGAKTVQALDNWGEKDSKPWSFRIAVENQIESIKNPIVQEFVEEFYDEFKDACVEAGYVVARSLDNWVALQKEQRRLDSQSESLIEIAPNRDAPDETILLHGDRTEIQTQTLNALNNYQFIESRDVGAWVGEPLLDSIRKPPKEVAIKILLRSAVKPPFKNQNGSNAKRTQIEIPNVDKTKINWREIKQAVGGLNGYLWGRFLVIARLDNEDHIKFYAASEAEGTIVLNKLLKFTKSELATLSIHEEKREGARKKYDRLFKEVTRVYPAYAVIINQKQLLTNNEGRATVNGYVDHRQIRVPLYVDDKPEEFDDLVNSLFVNAVVSN